MGVGKRWGKRLGEMLGKRLGKGLRKSTWELHFTSNSHIKLKPRKGVGKRLGSRPPVQILKDFYSES